MSDRSNDVAEVGSSNSRSGCTGAPSTAQIEMDELGRLLAEEAWVEVEAGRLSVLEAEHFVGRTVLRWLAAARA